MKRKIVQPENVHISFENAKHKEGYNSKKSNSKKKKRRKHDSDEIELESTKKIENIESNRVDGVVEKSTDSNNALEEAVDSDYEGTEKPEITKEESDRFSGKFMRNAFNRADGYSALQKFVILCDQNQKKDLVAEYLEAGGSVLEILRLLDNSEKRNINNIATVFTAMHLIIIKILAKYPHNQSSAEEACRHLINSHLASIHSMLSSQSKSKHRKVVLRLLAAIVSLGGTLPRELLNHLSLHPQLVEVLTSHSKPTDPQNVRTCFIHFILAFLVEGNASNIRVLLDKRAVFSGIFSGMVYDDSDVVQLVLATIKKYVLENPIVTKTMKLHLFSTPVIKDLIALYDWKGPKNWHKYKKQNIVQEHVSSEQKEIIINILHEFLITLLTSTRHGVAFNDRSLGSDFGSKHNQLINTVLQSLEKPWEHNKISELLIKILSACPDLIKPQLIYTEPFLVPRDSKNWIDVIQFVKKIINNIDIENCLNLCSTDMSLQQLTNAILNLILPPIVIKNAIIPSMEHTSILIHYEIIDVLLTILKKMESLLEKFKQSKHNKSEYAHFKNIVIEHISKHMPTFESILSIWNNASLALSNTEILSDDLLHSHVNIKDHLMMILNVLQVYSENFPEILFVENLTNAKNQPVTLLTSLDTIKSIHEEDLVVMKVKVLKILMTLNISDFAPNGKLFSSTLSFLLSQVGVNSILLNSEVLKTIYLLLNKCEIFEEYSDEIEIWINAINYFESIDHKLDIANWITKVVTRVTKHTKRYMSMMYTNEENIEKEDFATVSRENIFMTLSEKNIEDVKFIVPMLPASSMSLLVYGAVEHYQKNPTETSSYYLSHVLTHVLHCQISPAALISLTEELPVLSQKYITSWKKGQPATFPKKLFSSDNIFSILGKILINCDACKFDIADSKLCIQFDNSTNCHQLSDFEVKALFRMVVFYLIQLSQENCIDSRRIAVYSNILLVLIKIATESSAKDTLKGCIKYIFQHPILLQYFQPIFIDSKSTQFHITKLTIEILKVINIESELVASGILYLYQEKVVTQAKSFVHKHKDNDIESGLKVHLALVGLLKMNEETIIDLMATVMALKKDKFIVPEKRELSIWGILIPELIKQFILQIATRESKSIKQLDLNLLKKLIVSAIALKTHCKVEVTPWESSLFDYLLILPHSISIIDANVFTSLLKSEITPATEKILKLLVERNPKFMSILIKHANNSNSILHHKSLVFSIIIHNVKNKCDENFSRNIYEFYKTDITKYLLEGDHEHVSWIPHHINAVSFLVQKYFDPTLCKDVIVTILANEKKLDALCEEHITLLSIIFKKYSEVDPSALKNFVQILLHITVIVLKKDSKNNSKLNFLCQKLIESIEILQAEKEFLFDELVKYNSWPQFTRIILKSGLKMTKENKNENLLLKALVTSCDVAYRSNGNEEYVKTLFEMTTSHSEFINIMLSNAEIKSDLVKLLWVLVQKNHSLMSTSHIPLYLASYNATLAENDQLIFKLLQFYENNGVKLNEFRPYLWGNAAAMHYSVKGETDTALWRQPSTSQVLDLFISEYVMNTIKEFPTLRNWENDFSSAQQTETHVYDPAFYLPVLNQLLKENNLVACHKVIHSGALSLTIMACTSSCQKIRLKAFDTISKFAFHLETTRSKEKPLWANFIDALHNGIKQLQVPIVNVQLNGFVAAFLARTCLIITQPLNPLYSPLHAFLMAKPALNLNTIPELLQLYHSSEIHHQIHRHWILEVIRDGLKTSNDVDVALKCVLFKMLFDFYFSCIADKPTKNLILQVVKSATALTKLCTILVNGYSLVPWLMNVVKKLKKGDLLLSIHVIEIVNNIINVFKETKSRDNHHNLILTKSLLGVKNYFNQDLPEESLKSFVNLLNQTIANRTVCKAVSQSDLKSLVEFSKFFVQDVSDCELMLEFGCDLVDNEVLDEAVSLKHALRKLLVTWYTCTK